MSGIKKKLKLFQKQLAGYKRVSLDSSCFIYQLNDHPRFGELTHELFRSIEQGQMTAVTSPISIVEVFVRPEEEGDLELIKQYEELFLHFPNLEIAPLDWQRSRLASQFRARYALRTPDAIQLAVAKQALAEAFITNDDKLKKCREIEVLVLGDFV